MLYFILSEFTAIQTSQHIYLKQKKSISSHTRGRFCYWNKGAVKQQWCQIVWFNSYDKVDHSGHPNENQWNLWREDTTRSLSKPANSSKKTAETMSTVQDHSLLMKVDGRQWSF